MFNPSCENKKKKKNGTLNFCSNYCLLNSKTVPDRYSVPRILDLLDNLSGKKWFSFWDQKNTYHQIYLDGESQQLIVFITPWGLYKWVRVLFDAPAEFQRLMENCLMILTTSLHFHTIELSSNFTSYLEHVRIIFRQLKEKGKKINPEKIKFYHKKVNFMCGRITEDSY